MGVLVFIKNYLYLQQQSSLVGSKLSNAHFSGGKNSSVGNLILSNRSQGLLSVDVIHSFSGIQ